MTKNLAPSIFVLLACAPLAQAQFRPPSVPLIAHDPYFSVWSNTNELNGGVTRHWTGAEQPLTSLIRIDGRTYRLMGDALVATDKLPQTGVRVWPTRTVYTFAGAGVDVTLTFTTPSLPNDLDVMSRPTTYLTWDVKANDGQTHEIAVYFDADARLAVDRPNQNVEWGRTKAGSLNALRIGSQDQPILQKKGDDLRIDWGHLYVASTQKGYVGAGARSLEQFVQKGTLPNDERSAPRPASSNVVAAVVLPFGKVGSTRAAQHLTVAYDDLYSIQFMGHNLRPYWRRKGMDAKGLLSAAEKDYNRLTAASEAFDRAVTADLTRAGGSAYANIGALAYRQSLAAQKIVADAKGQPLSFSKENFSNGCIATVDVLYPAAPQLLLFSPTLTKASLVPILEYAASPRWKFPFAPHDIGTYPKANGQVYGGGERTEDNQMPVEESGNMIILLAALAKVEGNANFSAKYWPQLQKWAEYLADKGFDPESQLSTDDFAGHLAHNVNLSAKAIEALGAYAYLADLRGLKEESAKYRTLAQSFADRWVKEAADGDHYKLAFDKPGTWSQKYNLVWDRLLGFNLFPASVLRTEMDFYKTKMNPYGLPLDNRRDYTKLDWIVWTATLTGDRNDFETLVNPIVKFLNDTPDRAPMPDWFRTEVPRKEGFQARSVVGGVFIKLLEDAATWRKYANADRNPAGPWAAMPTPPVMTEIVPTASTASATWSYTFNAPPADWTSPSFNDSAWQKGAGGFGSGRDNGGATIRTEWTSDDIWVRREFNLNAADIKDIQLTIQHDDDAEVYINGVLALRLPGANRYETFELPKEAKAALKPGRNVLAIHCKETGGDQYLDAGLVTVRFK
jgi:hypothetical protein